MTQKGIIRGKSVMGVMRTMFFLIIFVFFCLIFFTILSHNEPHA